MPSTNLVGKNVKVYPFTFTDIPGTAGPNKTQIIDIIANNTSFDYFYAVPVINTSTWGNIPYSGVNLYDPPTLPTLPSAFNAETAALFDSAMYNWQLCSCFVSVSDAYDGTVPTSEAIGLFPNAYDITPYLNNNDFKGFIIYFPDIKFAYVLGRSANTQSSITSFNMLYDIEGSNTGTQCNIFPFIQFKDGTSCDARISGKYDKNHIAYIWDGTASGKSNNVRYSYRYIGNSISEAFIRNLDEDFIPPHIDDEDPYDPGGTSGPGGGTGDFDGSSDPIDFSPLPTLSAADTGFITLFNPTASQLKNLANYMWSNPAFDLSAWKKIFADPMDAVLGLSIVPLNIPNGGSKEVTVGNIGTGITMTVAASQYVTVDCGTINVNEYWGAYMDYSPYTKCSIYLPYCGTHPIKTDDIMNKAVHVKYNCDVLSGACIAQVKCGESVLYEFLGQLSSSIPITGDNWTNVVNGAIQIASSVGLMVASGGMSAPVTAGAKAFQDAGGMTALHGASAAATNVSNMKPEIEHSGAIGSTGGMLAHQKPYLILERPNQCLPVNQNGIMGYPSFMTRKLGNLSGYTEVEHINLENIPCTMKEAEEILKFLDGGVIL